MKSNLQFKAICVEKLENEKEYIIKIVSPINVDGRNEEIKAKLLLTLPDTNESVDFFDMIKVGDSVKIDVST